MSLSAVLKLLFLFHVVVHVYGFISSPPPKYPLHYSCRHLSQALDKDRSYSEKPFHFLSLDDLVFYYGDRANWWGDLDAHQTRTLYHQLLPTYYPKYLTDYSIGTLAVKAFQTRKAVKQYARRRSYCHVRFFSTLVDVLHNLWEYRRWSPLGATYEELWQKYKNQLEEQDVEASDHQIASTIVLKSCQTNEWIDFLCS